MTATGSATVKVSQAGTLQKIQVLTQGASGLDYTEASGGSCATGTAYSVGQTCTVGITFTPKYPGTRFGAAVLNDASGNVLGTAYLQGTGLGAQIGYLPFGSVGYSLNCPLSNSGLPTAGGGVAVDGGGNVYLTCPGDGSVHKETLTGNGQYTDSQIPTNIDGLHSLQGIAVDGAGNVYIADASANQVLMERPTGTSYTPVALNIAGLS